MLMDYARLTGQQPQDIQVNFLLSAYYVETKQLIMRALAPYDEAREAVARILIESDSSISSPEIESQRVNDDRE
jgi:hypothetical protein